MITLIQFHLLTAYPAVNLNRDNAGAPKTVALGGATRLCVSLQSLKRMWRISALFEQVLAGHTGTRSGHTARETATILIEKRIEKKKAIGWAAKIADYLGKAKNDKKPKDPLTNAETEQLVYISLTEFDAVKALAHQLAEEKCAPKEEDLASSRKDRMAVDIAMLGRTLVNKPEFNVEATCQVTYTPGVNETIVEDDFSTTIDDLRQAPEDAGAGHPGETGSDFALFYTYIYIDKDLLVENLGGDEVLVNQTIRAFMEAAFKTSPIGKQNSSASHVHTSWAMAEKGTEQPRSLAAAFYESINGTRQLKVAVQRITALRGNMNTVYEQKTECAGFDVMNKQGSMKDALDSICA